MHKRQQGLTFFGLLLVGVVLVMVGVTLAKVVPTYIEYYSVQMAVKKSASGNTVAEVREIFDKAAAISDITSISSQDLEIGKEGNQVVVAFDYVREIHLVGPAHLLMKYKGSSR